MINLNIVLEGCKATGKSTIANYFRIEGFKYFHSSSKTENDFKYHMSLLDGDNRIIDRFSVGEMIYPIIYNRKGKLNHSQFIKTMGDNNTIYVILYASDISFLNNRIVERGRATQDENLTFVELSNKMFKEIGEDIKNRNKHLLENDNVLLLDVCEYNSKQIIMKVVEKLNEKI